MNRTYRLLALFIVIMTGAGSMSVLASQPPYDPNANPASIIKTKHNLSRTGPGQYRALVENRICVFCHTPHNANPLTPLWNRQLSGVNYTLYSSTTLTATVHQPTGPSRLCLSCHDGSLALGAVLQPSLGISMNVAGGIPASRSSNFGAALDKHHPVSFSYNQSALSNPEINPIAPTADLLFYGGGKSLECTTCHDPHDNTNKKFLRVQANNGALCVKCHLKNGWDQSTHKSSSHTWNGSGTNPWPWTGSGTDFGWLNVQANGCQNCHAPHNADGSKRLLNFQEEENNCYPCHNGNAATTDVYNDFLKSSTHQVALTTIGITANHHEPNESPWMITDHVECADCHNPHAVNNQSATAPAVSGMLAKVSGVDINNAPLNPPAFYASNEYEICLKCHADATWRYGVFYTPVPRIVNTIDVRQAIQTGNPSFHPVAGIGKNATVPSLIAPLTTSSKIYCTDCHDSDNSRSIGGTGPRGPHGSQYAPLIRQRYVTADLNSDYQTGYYALCYSCHSEASILSDDANSFGKNGSGYGGHSGHLQRTGAANTAVYAPCAVCHDPHGVSDDGAGAHTHLINFASSSVTATGGNPKPLYTDSGSHHGSCTLVCHGVVHDGSATYSY